MMEDGSSEVRMGNKKRPIVEHVKRRGPKPPQTFVYREIVRVDKEKSNRMIAVMEKLTRDVAHAISVAKFRLMDLRKGLGK